MSRHRRSINISVRVPLELHQALVDIAGATEATISDVAREALTFVLQMHSKSELIRARFSIDDRDRVP